MTPAALPCCICGTTVRAPVWVVAGLAHCDRCCREHDLFDVLPGDLETAAVRSALVAARRAAATVTELPRPVTKTEVTP
jgi:hypothetical protein